MSHDNPTIVIERREIVIDRTPKELVIQHVPGVGPPGSPIGGWSINGEPPFDMTGSIEGAGGVAVVAQGIRRFTAVRPGTLAYCLFSAGVPPTGQSLVFDVNKNGSSLWSNPIDRPKIDPGTYTSAKVVPDFASFISGDYFTVDIDQIGSPNAGGAITFSIWYF